MAEQLSLFGETTPAQAAADDDAPLLVARVQQEAGHSGKSYEEANWAKLSPLFRRAHNRLRVMRCLPPIPEPKIDLYVPPALRKIANVSAVMMAMAVTVCGCHESADMPSPSTAPTFANPEPVTIIGYTGPQEDPVATPDGKYLFFDSHTDDPSIPVKAYYATAIDYKTFQFVGEIGGINIPGKATANPNMDLRGNFYFMTDARYSQTLNTAFRGAFSNGSVSGISPILGVSRNQMGWAVMAPEIDLDGNILHYADFKPPAMTSSLVVASKNPDGSFTKLSNSAAILANVNAVGRLVYGAYLTADGLNVAFTKATTATTGAVIYTAHRNVVTDPWGIPKQVTAAVGWVESGSFSPDGQRLYYHRLDPNSLDPKIFVLTKTQH